MVEPPAADLLEPPELPDAAERWWLAVAPDPLGSARLMITDTSASAARRVTHLVNRTPADGRRRGRARTCPGLGRRALGGLAARSFAKALDDRAPAGRTLDDSAPSGPVGWARTDSALGRLAARSIVVLFSAD